MSENYRLTPDNGICVPDFIDNFEDQTLHLLKDFLVKLAKDKVEDVRGCLHQFNP